MASSRQPPETREETGQNDSHPRPPRRWLPPIREVATPLNRSPITGSRWCGCRSDAYPRRAGL